MRDTAQDFLRYSGTLMASVASAMLAVHCWQGYVQARDKPKPTPAAITLSGPQEFTGSFEMLEPRPGEAYRIKFAGGPCAYREASDDFVERIHLALEEGRMRDAALFERGTVHGTGTGQCVSIENFIVKGKEFTKLRP